MKKNSFSEENGAAIVLAIFMIVVLLILSSCIVWLLENTSAKVDAENEARKVAITAATTYANADCNLPPNASPSAIRTCHKDKLRVTVDTVKEMVNNSNGIMNNFNIKCELPAPYCISNPNADETLELVPAVYFKSFPPPNGPNEMLFELNASSAPGLANAFLVRGKLKGDRFKNTIESFFKSLIKTSEVEFLQLAKLNTVVGIFLGDISSSASDITHKNLHTILTANSQASFPTAGNPWFKDPTNPNNIPIDPITNSPDFAGINPNDFLIPPTFTAFAANYLGGSNYNIVDGNSVEYGLNDTVFEVDHHWNNMIQDRSALSASGYGPTSSLIPRDLPQVHVQNDYKLIASYSSSLADYMNYPDRDLHVRPGTGSGTAGDPVLNPGVPSASNIGDPYWVRDVCSLPGATANCSAPEFYALDLYRKTTGNQQYLGPEPLTSVFAGLNEAFRRFDESGGPANRATMIFYGSNDPYLDWQRTGVLTDNFSYWREILDPDEYSNPNLYISSGSDTPLGILSTSPNDTTVPTWIRLGMFPRPWSKTPFLSALEEAVRQIRSDPTLIEAQTFIVNISDGLMTCPFSTGCDDSAVGYYRALDEVNQFFADSLIPSDTAFHMYMLSPASRGKYISTNINNGSNFRRCGRDDELRELGIRHVEFFPPNTITNNAWKNRFYSPLYEVGGDMYNLAFQTGGKFKSRWIRGGSPLFNLYFGWGANICTQELNTACPAGSICSGLNNCFLPLQDECLDMREGLTDFLTDVFQGSSSTQVIELPTLPIAVYNGPY